MSNVPESFVRTVVGIFVAIAAIFIAFAGARAVNRTLTVANKNAETSTDAIQDSFYTRYNGETYTGSQVVDLIEKMQYESKYVAVHQDNNVYYFICKYTGTETNPDAIEKIKDTINTQLYNARSTMNLSGLYLGSIRYSSLGAVLGLDFERVTEKSNEVARKAIVDTVGKGNPPPYSQMTDTPSGNKTTENEQKKEGKNESEQEYVPHQHVDGKGNVINADKVAPANYGGCFTIPIYHVHTDSGANPCIIYHRHVYTSTQGITNNAGNVTDIVGDEDQEELPDIIYLEDRVNAVNEKLANLDEGQVDTSDGKVVNDYNPSGQRNCFTNPVYYEHIHTDKCLNEVIYHSHETSTGRVLDEENYPNFNKALKNGNRRLSEAIKDDPTLDINIEGNGGCFIVPVYHEHTAPCYEVVKHTHKGNPYEYGGCYTESVYHVHTPVAEKTTIMQYDNLTLIGTAQYKYKRSVTSTVSKIKNNGSVVNGTVTYGVANSITYKYWERSESGVDIYTTNYNGNDYQVLASYFHDYVSKNGNSGMYMLDKPKQSETPSAVEYTMTFGDFQLKSGPAVSSGYIVSDIRQTADGYFTVYHNYGESQYWGVFPGNLKNDAAYDDKTVHTGILNMAVENPTNYNEGSISNEHLKLSVKIYSAKVYKNGSFRLVSEEYGNPREVTTKVKDEGSCYKAKYYYPVYQWQGVKSLLPEKADQYFYYENGTNNTYTYTAPETGTYTFYVYGPSSGIVRTDTSNYNVTQVFNGNKKTYTKTLQKGDSVTIRLGRVRTDTPFLSSYNMTHAQQDTIVVLPGGTELRGEAGHQLEQGENTGNGFVEIHRTQATEGEATINDYAEYQWDGTRKKIKKDKTWASSGTEREIEGLFFPSVNGYIFVDENNQKITDCWLYTDKNLEDNSEDNIWYWYHFNSDGVLDTNKVINSNPLTKNNSKAIVNYHGRLSKEKSIQKRTINASKEFIDKVKNGQMSAGGVGMDGNPSRIITYSEWMDFYWDHLKEIKQPYKNTSVWKYAGDDKSGYPYAYEYYYDANGNMLKEGFTKDYSEEDGNEIYKYYNKDGLYVSIEESKYHETEYQAEAFSAVVNTNDKNSLYGGLIARQFINNKYYEWRDNNYTYSCTATMINHTGAEKLTGSGLQIIDIYNYVDEGNAGRLYKDSDNSYRWTDGTYQYIMRPVLISYTTIDNYIPGAIYEDKAMGYIGNSILNCTKGGRVDHYALGCGKEVGQVEVTDNDNIPDTFLLTNSSVISELGYGGKANVLVRLTCKYHTKEDVAKGVISMYEANEEKSIIDWEIGYAVKEDFSGNPVTKSGSSEYVYHGCKILGVGSAETYDCGLAEKTLVGYSIGCGKYSNKDVEDGVIGIDGYPVKATAEACKEGKWSKSDELTGKVNSEQASPEGTHALPYDDNILQSQYGPILESARENTSIKATVDAYGLSCTQ